MVYKDGTSNNVINSSSANSFVLVPKFKNCRRLTTTERGPETG